MFFFASLVLAASVAFLAGCAKEIDAPEDTKIEDDAIIDPNEETLPGIPFELIAGTTEDTKTTMSEGNPVWVANDKMNVFYAPASTSTYSVNCEFTITSANLAEKKFTGSLPGSYDSEASYDWYALYPYNSNIDAPNLTSGDGKSLAIGSATKGTKQVQVGNNSTSHLAGQYFPLYGMVSAVTGDTAPTLLMKQALAVVKVHVTNSTDAPLTVSSVAFTAPEDITGKYWIDFTGAEPSFTKIADGDVSSTANLNVTSGTPIAVDNSADFYIAIKPFTVSSGNLIVTVNGKTKKIAVSSSTTFHPGKIKKVNFNYKDHVDLDWTYPVGDAAATKSELMDLDGVTASGLGSDYDVSHAPYRIKFDDSDDYIQVKTNTEISSVSVKYKMIGGGNTSHLNIYQSTDGSSWGEAVESLTISGASSSVGTLTTTEEFSSSARYVKIVFDKGSNVGIGGITIRTFGSEPRISAPDIEVSALGVTNEYATYTPVNFAGVDDVEVFDTDGCVKSATIEDGKIKYSVDATYGISDILGTIVLNSPSNSVSKTVNVTQKGNTLSQVGATGSPLVLTIPAAQETASIDITSSVFSWNATAANVSERNLTIVTSTSPLTYGSSHSGLASPDAQTITVHSETPAPSSGDPIELGTLVVYRNNNSSDTQKLQITVKKAASGGYAAVPNQTHTFSEKGYDNSATVSSIAGTTNCSIVFDKGTGSNDPKYYDTGESVRAYSNNTITITANSGFKITSISFTFGTGDGTNTISADKGTYSAGSWTGTIENGSSVVFSVSSVKSNHRRISSITIN